MVRLRYFRPEEFRTWLDHMSPRLLVLLDLFRYKWGHAVQISPHHLALGRRMGESNTSQHNVDRWGEVRAADVMPYGINTAKDMGDAVITARDCGFTGIGIYPHWKPRSGLHLDVRESSEMGYPATWAALDVSEATPEQKRYGKVVGGQVYVSLRAGYEAMR